MQNKTLSLAAAAVAVGVTTVIVAGATYAYQGGVWHGEEKTFNVFMGGARGEMREQMQAALESGDYAAWLEAVGKDSPLAEKITAENFAKFAEMHQAMEDGNTERAAALRDELAMPDMKFFHGKKMHAFAPGMMMLGGGMHNADIKAAIDAGDYETFRAAVEAQSPLRYITAENFSEYVAAAKAATNGEDFTKLKAFHEQYGQQK